MLLICCFSFFLRVELDETIGDIHSMIVGQEIIRFQGYAGSLSVAPFVDREIEIMQRLQETVLEYTDSLHKIAHVCAEMDW